ncbi:hypothetical protein [Streptomyces cyaneofuscatus]|uniref:hypothetical protein n=1 Tax=Streptomyces cyaneofuscatus TaxID=66883 RepID=UPI0033A7CE0B
MSTDTTPAPPRSSAERLAPDDPRLSFDGITGWSREGGTADPLPLRMPLERLGTTLSANLARLARTTAEAVGVLQRLGDRALHLVDGLTVVPVEEAGRVYADGLHPTAEGEYVLADRIGAALEGIPLS